MPIDEANLHQTLGRLLASAETAAENTSYLRTKVDELRVDMARIGTVKEELHATVETHDREIRGLTAFKNRAIGARLRPGSHRRNGRRRHRRIGRHAEALARLIPLGLRVEALGIAFRKRSAI